ncbi:hypothetical protein [Nocardioides aequoreus]|uniref:hypothetical protein n=1 Tax=Nocardioides aequoreus TaxID=397278 RepID=UPI000A02C79C|nr:hypothetical protein [Nocardioides aequoreus]
MPVAGVLVLDWNHLSARRVDAPGRPTRKGGLVGDDETAVACLEFLEQSAQARRRHVAPARTH